MYYFVILSFLVTIDTPFLAITNMASSATIAISIIHPLAVISIIHPLVAISIIHPLAATTNTAAFIPLAKFAIITN